MIRTTLCSLALLGLATGARAGELDNEAPPAKKPAATAAANPVAAATAPTGSELDKESPEAAHGWRGYWGHGPVGYGYGFRFHYGFAGFYRPPVFWGPAFYPGFASYRVYSFPGFYGGFYPGFYGGYYSPFFNYGGFYPGFYGWGW
ncbi:MAG TPA: hypothetical protein VKE74_34935 [Gemmataceae bacterium]|nr:hypothetical protein [Gemmataceae bacterium]